MEEKALDLLDHVADIVTSFVSANSIEPAALPALIEAVHDKLRKLAAGEPDRAPLVPAVDPRRSVQRDFVICLEDGKRFQSLRRHLGVHHRLTPEEYRARWGLPKDYPMVAPNYGEKRSALAKASGLGRKPDPKRKARKGR